MRTTIKNKRGFAPPPPKPCPTCYEPMTNVSADPKKMVYECARHGRPTRR